MNLAHPRFPQRGIALGGALFFFGILGRLVEHKTAMVAAMLLAVTFSLRFLLELRITGEERESDVAPALWRISLLNQFSIMLLFFGLLGYMRER